MAFIQIYMTTTQIRTLKFKPCSLILILLVVDLSLSQPQLLFVMHQIISTSFFGRDIELDICFFLFIYHINFVAGLSRSQSFIIHLRFSNAIQVLGLKHICDNMMQSALSSMELILASKQQETIIINQSEIRNSSVTVMFNVVTHCHSHWPWQC